MSPDAEFPDFLCPSDFSACFSRDQKERALSTRAFNVVCRYADLIHIENMRDAVPLTAGEVGVQQATRVFALRNACDGKNPFVIDRASLLRTIEGWRGGNAPDYVGRVVMAALEVVHERYSEPNPQA